MMNFVCSETGITSQQIQLAAYTWTASREVIIVHINVDVPAKIDVDSGLLTKYKMGQETSPSLPSAGLVFVTPPEEDFVSLGGKAHFNPMFLQLCSVGY